MNRRNSCAEDLDVAAYLDGRMTPEERETFSRHLSRDRACRSTMSIIRSVLASAAPSSVPELPEQLVQQAAALHPGSASPDIVISFLRDALAVVSAALDVSLSVPAAAAAVRKSRATPPSMITIRKAFESVNAEVGVEKLRGNLCNISVLVTDGTRAPAPANLRVNLVSGGRELASNLLENGRALFEDVGRGRYDIVIERKGMPFGSVAIKIV